MPEVIARINNMNPYQSSDQIGDGDCQYSESDEYDDSKGSLYLTTPAQFQMPIDDANDTRSLNRLVAATETPGEFFASIGRTPMTGASLGSTNPTPSRKSNADDYGGENSTTASVSMGLSSIGLLRGNNPLGPTPLVRRRDGLLMHEPLLQQPLPTPSPRAQYHHRMTSSAVRNFRGQRNHNVDEEDPAMLRYASMQGADNSPLVAWGATMVKKDSDINEDNVNIESSRISLNQQSQVQNPPIVKGPPIPIPEPHAQVTAALSEFPFYFDGYTSWICRHCNHIPMFYRGENHIWHYPQAPPNDFVDRHLTFCPGLNPVAPPQQRQSGTNDFLFHPSMPPGGGGMPYPMQPQHTQFIKQERNAPDPPTGRSPPSILFKQEPKVNSNPNVPDYFYRQPQYATQSLQHPGYTNSQAPHTSAIPPYMMPPHGLQPPPFPYGLPVDPSPARTKRRSTGKNVSPKGLTSDNVTYAKAVDHLEKVGEGMTDLSEPGSDIGSTLVEGLDKDLITDYFFHVMKQLVVCRFTEKDRKTRGGKRENIAIGYGGLQCRNCIGIPSSRKFFWSNVDRLANSFAEIPSHVLKCKSTPEDIRDSLLVLKGRHAEQMQSISRGSQKVFFRRMWRRIHDGDATGGNTPSCDRIEDETSELEASNDPDYARPSSNRILQESLDAESSKTVNSRSAARILAESIGAEVPRIRDGVLLAIPEDKDWLSDDQCFVRNNIEVFTATQHDIQVAVDDRKYPIKSDQVGIRCLHCGKTPQGPRGTAVLYPFTISGIYESVREFQRMHFEKCENLPPDVVAASLAVVKGSTSLSSVLRRYYVQAARALGLADAKEGGILAGANPEPMSHAGFTSPTTSHRTASAAQGANLVKREPSLVDPVNLLLEMSRKRKASPSLFDESLSPSKKPHPNEEQEDIKSTADV